MTCRFLISAALSLFLVLPVAASEGPIQENNTNAIWFENWVGLSNGWMRIASPDGEMTTITAEQGTPVFQLSASEAIDGVYRYELRASTEEMVKNHNYSEGGIDGNDQEYYPKSFYRTGYFVVERGVITRPDEMEEEGRDQ